MSDTTDYDEDFEEDTVHSGTDAPDPSTLDAQDVQDDEATDLGDTDDHHDSAADDGDGDGE